MLIIKASEALQRAVETMRQNGARIGFVPTMGALHEGHLALVRAAKASCGSVVCSIFVNPTQFNDPTDLEAYPRTVGRDIGLLLEAGCDLLFLPAPEVVYPEEMDTRLDLNPGTLASVLEGAFRPGHFTGVMQVVKRLLDLVLPDELHMGQKDYQQVAVMRFMLKALGSPVRLVVGPTVREENGLAMSSRNALLSPAGRLIAPGIYQTLRWMAENLGTLPPRQLEQEAIARLEENGLRPEYVCLADGDTLLPVGDPAAHQSLVALVAARAGKVRLIDNLVIKGQTVS
jgi:pantoate--beta-alanine ligase